MLEKALENFWFTRLKFTVVPEDKIVLPPYKGSTFRGGFGHAFKRAVCVADETCQDCILENVCLYSYVFDTPLPEGATIMRKYPYAPHPFVIEPPEEEQAEYTADDEIRFNLVLIGKAVGYLPYFVHAFSVLGKLGLGKGLGKYKLKEVSFYPIGGESRLLYSEESNLLKQENIKLNFKDLPIEEREELTLKLCTPMRIKYEGSLTDRLEFHILIRNLLRRTSLLSYFHCGEELTLDFKGIIEAAKEIKLEEHELEWYDWERYSARQDERMKLGGLVGQVSFSGDLRQFLPLIKLGEYLHVGKGTAFGLGRYEMAEEFS